MVVVILHKVYTFIGLGTLHSVRFIESRLLSLAFFVIILAIASGWKQTISFSLVFHVQACLQHFFKQARENSSWIEASRVPLESSRKHSAAD